MMRPTTFLTAIYGLVVAADRSSTLQSAMSAFSNASVAFRETWSVLGPFQIGTREAAWGADPLECYGGFSSLLPGDANASFKSSLARDGVVKWTSTNASLVDTTAVGSKTSVTFSFPDVDFDFLQKIYGWSTFQWQGWARGEIFVDSTQPVKVAFFTNSVLEYAIDGAKIFGGDFFEFKKSPHVLTLTPGKHVLDMRLIREVRAMGGVGEPVLDINLEMTICQEPIEVIGSTAIVSDVIDGRLPSPYASVDIRNNGNEWVEVWQVSCNSKEDNTCVSTGLLNDNTKTIAPGQTRPLVFLVYPEKQLLIDKLKLYISYRHRGEDGSALTRTDLDFTLPLKHKSAHDPHKLTHLHPGSIVSYSILRAPSPNASCPSASAAMGAPIMLQLHGAGVEADSPMMMDVINDFPDLCAWLLFPSGVTPWSADDWHVWGFADVLASINGIKGWIKNVQWQGVGVDTEKLYAGGHSNGGQGAWYTLLHWPDKVFAASPLSGYLSIQEYVPYKFWKPAEPKKRAIVEAVTNSYRSEYLAKNAMGIPIQQQHGSADDNVPAYHSRQMSQLLSEAGSPNNYSEIAGAGHWWDGIVTTDVLKDFYQASVAKAHDATALPEEFELIVANPADTGAKYGYRVLYLEEPGELGRLRGRRDKTTGWSIETDNILAFKWDPKLLKIDSVVLDGIIVKAGENPYDTTVELWRSSGTWSTKRPDDELRSIDHFGGLDAILRTNGPFEIMSHSNKTLDLALQISRNLHQYFYADSVLVDGSVDTPSTPSHLGNRITLTLDETVPHYLSSLSFPIQIHRSSSGSTKDDGPSISVLAPNRPTKTYSSSSEGLGAIYLRPLGERLELAIWATDLKMLAQVARLAPTMTGIGAPDWIIMSESAAWKGIDGFAMGFFDARWEVSSMSSFTLG